MKNDSNKEHGSIDLLELVEVKAWGDLYRVTPQNIAKSLGIELIESGHSVITIASRMDVLAFNRVIGLGIKDEVSADRIDSIISSYQKAGVRRFFIQVCLEAAPSYLPDMLIGKGFTHYNNWVKLYRPIDPSIDVDSGVEIRKIGPEEASTFAAIIVTSFEWPGEMAPWIASLVGQPGWHFYLAYYNQTPMGTGGFYIDGEYAWIDFASTLAEYRGLGAQGAMVRKRIEDARALGCRWLTVETAEQKPEKEAPSYRNMLRYGFKQAYLRPNYIYNFPNL